MFVFVVPFKGRSSSLNWSMAAKLCERAVASMLANRSPDLRVILVCNEVPDGLPDDRRLIVKSIVTPAPSTKYEMMTDKFIKFKTGLVLARDFAPAWLMRADADDLVSTELVSFAEKQEIGQFLYSEFGWLHQLGSRFVIKRNDFHKICGTSQVAYATRDDLPSSVDGDHRSCYLLTEEHSIIVAARKAAGMPTRPIPFCTTVYVVNSGENHSGLWLRTDHDRRTRLRLLFDTRIVTLGIRREFGLWPLNTG